MCLPLVQIRKSLRDQLNSCLSGTRLTLRLTNVGIEKADELLTRFMSRSLSTSMTNLVLFSLAQTRSRSPMSRKVSQHHPTRRARPNLPHLHMRERTSYLGDLLETECQLRRKRSPMMVLPSGEQLRAPLSRCVKLHPGEPPQRSTRRNLLPSHVR